MFIIARHGYIRGYADDCEKNLYIILRICVVRGERAMCGKRGLRPVAHADSVMVATDYRPMRMPETAEPAAGANGGVWGD